MSKTNISVVLKKNVDKLMAVPGVVGVAEGEYEGKPCIKVFVVKRNPELLRQITGNIEGYPLQIEESGKFHALDNQ